MRKKAMTVVLMAVVVAALIMLSAPVRTTAAVKQRRPWVCMSVPAFNEGECDATAWARTKKVADKASRDACQKKCGRKCRTIACIRVRR